MRLAAWSMTLSMAALFIWILMPMGVAAISWNRVLNPLKWFSSSSISKLPDIPNQAESRPEIKKVLNDLMIEYCDKITRDKKAQDVYINRLMFSLMSLNADYPEKVKNRLYPNTNDPGKFAYERTQSIKKLDALLRKVCALDPLLFNQEAAILAWLNQNPKVDTVTPVAGYEIQTFEHSSIRSELSQLLRDFGWTVEQLTLKQAVDQLITEYDAWSQTPTRLDPATNDIDRARLQISLLLAVMPATPQNDDNCCCILEVAGGIVCFMAGVGFIYWLLTLDDSNKTMATLTDETTTLDTTTTTQAPPWWAFPWWVWFLLGVIVIGAVLYIQYSHYKNSERKQQRRRRRYGRRGGRDSDDHRGGGRRVRARRRPTNRARKRVDRRSRNTRHYSSSPKRSRPTFRPSSSKPPAHA